MLILKKILKLSIKIFTNLFIKFFSKINAGRYFIDELSNAILQKKKIINHKDLKFNFYVPNRLNFFRIETFSTKEPETLDWIDTFEKNSVFWDIGANIGLYSCYAVKRAGCYVYAFEPSVFNLELLTKNIHLNSLSNKITIISLPLCEDLSSNTFYMSSKEWGGALSNFGEEGEHNDFLRDNKLFQYNTVGLSIDQCINFLKISKPDYIKIDVDGIENLILKGATNALENVRSLLVEVNDNDKKQAKDIEEYLTKAGFKMRKKTHSKIIEESEKFRSFFNQVWSK